MVFPSLDQVSVFLLPFFNISGIFSQKNQITQKFFQTKFFIVCVLFLHSYLWLNFVVELFEYRIFRIYLTWQLCSGGKSQNSLFWVYEPLVLNADLDTPLHNFTRIRSNITNYYKSRARHKE